MEFKLEKETKNKIGEIVKLLIDEISKFEEKEISHVNIYMFYTHIDVCGNDSNGKEFYIARKVPDIWENASKISDILNIHISEGTDMTLAIDIFPDTIDKLCRCVIGVGNYTTRKRTRNVNITSFVFKIGG